MYLKLGHALTEIGLSVEVSSFMLMSDHDHLLSGVAPFTSMPRIMYQFITKIQVYVKVFIH